MKLGAPLSGLQAEVRARINLDVEIMAMSWNLRCLVAQSHKNEPNKLQKWIYLLEADSN